MHSSISSSNVSSQEFRARGLSILLAERDRRLIRAKSLEDLEAARDRCRTLAGFVREAWHVLEPTTRYVHDWHHDVISEHLEAIHPGEITRLQINQPPGTAKSFFASVCFNAWEWGPGGKPGLRYLTTAYMEKWARTHARKTRDLVTSEWYRTLWPNVALVRDNEMDFENTSRGVRTGKGLEHVRASPQPRPNLPRPRESTVTERLSLACVG
jgi:hypothetical protein